MKNNNYNIRMEEDFGSAEVLLKELLACESHAWDKLEQIRAVLGETQGEFLKYELLRRKHFYLQVLCKKEQLFCD